MKIDNWPQAVVVAVGIVTVGGVVAFLVSAGWSADAIGAFVTLALGIFGAQFAAARKVATIDAKTDQQSAQLLTITHQTDGQSGTERSRLAELTADHVIRKLAGSKQSAQLFTVTQETNGPK